MWFGLSGASRPSYQGGAECAVVLVGVSEQREGGHRPPVLEADLALVHEALPRLTDLAGQRAGTLSGGEQQMLVLAKALVGGPRLLMIDELSLGLAPMVRA